jgi:fucose 4-O-acetylase-like acetyltransferase
MKQDSKILNRDPSIDALRCIGLLCIMLVHILPPSIIGEFRTFDVCLMVFISASLYKPAQSFRDYFIKRLYRLIIPTWIFISIYMVYRFILGNVLKSATALDLWEIFNTYLLIDVHLGPIWVIRVFLLMALISPLLFKFSQKPQIYSLGILLVILILQDLLIIALPLIKHFYLKFYIDKFILYLIGYSFVALTAMCIKQSRSKLLLSICIVCSAIIFIAPMLLNGLKPCSAFKYPPHSIYLLYGVSMSFILWYFRYIYIYISGNQVNIIQFVGRNSLWIYFYHILCVEIANKFICNWPCRFLFVLIFSTGLYALQYYAVKRYFHGSFAKYLVG